MNKYLEGFAAAGHFGSDESEQVGRNGPEDWVETTRRADVIQEAEHVGHEARITQVVAEHVQYVVGDGAQLYQSILRRQSAQVRQKRTAGAFYLRTFGHPHH